ncbi:hypothetical protein BVRB_1g023040 [Beta vulgaris subsp. vulgaris]|uniref:Uncharacterized protein n=1 Tax=Beta vulgaris subsp. vulgaris TaxID=3555 RepID=A0A0J8BHQ1_BETVV|nr:hypothetical protein BVRB_1g023040 [Beta vulgaris subsp. vulgaris]
MSQPLITAKALRTAKCRKLAKSGSGSCSASKAVIGASTIRRGENTPSILAPKPEPKEVKVEDLPVVKAEDPPAAAGSSAIVTKAMAKANKAFKDKVAEVKHAVEVATAQRESASKRQNEALKDCKKADQRADKAQKNAEAAIAKAR